jgi:hypothetical protein
MTKGCQFLVRWDHELVAESLFDEVLWRCLTRTSRDIALLVSSQTLKKEENMDHEETVRKFQHLRLREADHAHEVAAELEALVPFLPNGKSRQLAQFHVKASHKQARGSRELAQKVKET